MSTVEVAAVTIDPGMGLLVRPVAGYNYEHVYRAANGLRWSEQDASVVAYEPQRWTVIELARHIVKTIQAECGDSLTLSTRTSWGEVDPLTRAAIEQAFKEAAT